jgi:hypothetical protein
MTAWQNTQFDYYLTRAFSGQFQPLYQTPVFLCPLYHLNGLVWFHIRPLFAMILQQILS